MHVTMNNGRIPARQIMHDSNRQECKQFERETTEIIAISKVTLIEVTTLAAPEILVMGTQYSSRTKLMICGV